jgi:hypothetical protein
LSLSGFLGVGGFGVNFGDHDGGFGGEVIGNGFPNRSQSLAICQELVYSFKVVKAEDLRPHQGAVNATRTLFSFPMVSLKSLSFSMATLLGALFDLGLIPVCSVM